MLYYAMLCSILLCNAMLWYVTLCHVLICAVQPGCLLIYVVLRHIRSVVVCYHVFCYAVFCYVTLRCVM